MSYTFCFTQTMLPYAYINYCSFSSFSFLFLLCRFAFPSCTQLLSILCLELFRLPPYRCCTNRQPRLLTKRNPPHTIYVPFYATTPDIHRCFNNWLQDNSKLPSINHLVNLQLFHKFDFFFYSSLVLSLTVWCRLRRHPMWLVFFYLLVLPSLLPYSITFRVTFGGWVLFVGVTVAIFILIVPLGPFKSSSGIRFLLVFFSLSFWGNCNLTNWLTKYRVAYESLRFRFVIQ